MDLISFLITDTQQQPSITFNLLDSPRTKDVNGATLSRFGAQALIHQNSIIVVGGIVKDILLPFTNEICVSGIKTTAGAEMGLRFSSLPTYLEPRALLIGTTVVSSGEDIIIMGGSAVCFSFGTFWNKGCYTLTRRYTNDTSVSPWKFVQCIDGSVVPKATSTNLPSPAPGIRTLVKVPRVKLSSSADFDKILGTGKPVIIEDLDIGSCTEKWIPGYLKDNVGTEKEVGNHPPTHGKYY